MFYLQQNFMLVFYFFIYTWKMSPLLSGKVPKSERITSMTEKVVNRIEVGVGNNTLQRAFLVRGDLP
jgi:hypothetical protein